MRLRSVSNNRYDCTCRVERRGNRAVGSVFFDNRHFKDFNVAIDADDGFVINVGSSGTKVRFNFRRNQIGPQLFEDMLNGRSQ